MFLLYNLVMSVNKRATTVINGRYQTALHFELYVHLYVLKVRGLFPEAIRAELSSWALQSCNLAAALLDRLTCWRMMTAVVCVPHTGLMAMTYSLLVVSSLPSAPFLPPLSVQMEWISDEC